MLIGQLHNFLLHLGAVGASYSSFFLTLLTLGCLFLSSFVYKVPGTSLSFSCTASSRTHASLLLAKVIFQKIFTHWQWSSLHKMGREYKKEMLLVLRKVTEEDTPEAFSRCSYFEDWHLTGMHSRNEEQCCSHFL